MKALNSAGYSSDVIYGMKPRTLKFRRPSAIRNSRVMTTQVFIRPRSLTSTQYALVRAAAFGATTIGSTLAANYAGRQAGVYAVRRVKAAEAYRKSYRASQASGSTASQSRKQSRIARRASMRSTRGIQVASLQIGSNRRRRAYKSARSGGGGRPPKLTTAQRQAISRNRRRDQRGRFR